MSFNLNEKIRENLEMGFTNQQIAEMLDISGKTAKRRRRDLYVQEKYLNAEIIGK